MFARFAVALACAVSAGPAWAQGAAPSFSNALKAVRAAVWTAPDGSAKPFQSQSNRERDTLVRLLDDPDASVRRAAVRSLKNYVGQTSRVRDAVLSVYRDDREELSVRYEAAKTLAFANQVREVSDSLLRYARYGELPRLRSISYKALYNQAAGSSRMRDDVLHAARYESDPEVRLGAIWALFAASGDNRVGDALMNMAERGTESAVRVEALKSLYSGMGSSRVRDRIARLASDASEDGAVRVPAVLLLSNGTSSRTQDTLSDIAAYDKDPEVRRAAILALNPSDIRISEYFHLLRRTQTGQLIDPLAGE